MRINTPKLNLKLIIGLVFCLVQSNLVCQERVILAPRLDSSSLCANDFQKNYTLLFNFEANGGFNGDNEFIIEMSDASGSFEDVVFNVGRILDQNNSYIDIEGTITLPEGTYGEGYRFRIRSTSPEVTGEESVALPAYYRRYENALVLNDRTDVVLCGGAPQEVVLTGVDEDLSYIWHKDGATISGETGPSLTITQPGEYYAAINYGSCSGGDDYNSNKVIATILSDSNVGIAGDSVVELCANDTYDLIATVDDRDYTYNWYKDDVLIEGLDAYSPTYNVGTSNQYGVYHLEMGIGDCLSRTSNVTIQPESGIDFDINIEAPSTRVFLPGETLEISITHTASNADIQWYKDGEILVARRGLAMNVIEPGVYYAEVTDNSTSCPVALNSEEYTILDVTDLSIEIRTDTEYTECNSESTVLSIVGIKALATDGVEYDLTSDQLLLLNYQWLKDGAAITGGTNVVYNVGSYIDNGAYSLSASSLPLSSNSEAINVLLSVDSEITSSSPSNALCPGGTINLSVPTVSGFNYTWFKDEEELTVPDVSNILITEIGVYDLIVEGFGCEQLQTVTIVEFDDSVLQTTPLSTLVFQSGETGVLTASGADSYEWYSEDGVILSTNETLEVTTLGSYRVVGRVGLCEAERIINVVEDDKSPIIPNILSPFNNDGINDTWQIPNRFAFRTDVNVVIYDSRGKEVFNIIDYQNDWPNDTTVKPGMLFYFKVIKEDVLIKAGTISVLE